MIKIITRVAAGAKKNVADAYQSFEN